MKTVIHLNYTEQTCLKSLSRKNIMYIQVNANYQFTTTIA